MARYLVTGGAGFIGANVVRALLHRGHTVRVIDNFFTGFRHNIEPILNDIELFDGSICDESLLGRAMDGVDSCLHIAAIGSVPRSIANPIPTNQANVEGTLKVILAARDAGLRRVVFSSSSSIYGNHSTFPTTEDTPRNPASPYAASKAAAEVYAEIFSGLYDIDLVGLRYFNVFGPYQNPNSEYSAVIPVFIKRLLAGKSITIHGDGSQSRDFSFVENVISANLLAAEAPGAIRGMYNIACGATTSVLDLATMLGEIIGAPANFDFVDSRAGDIHKSLASVEKARKAFGYAPLVNVREGLEKTVAWYREQMDRLYA